MEPTVLRVKRLSEFATLPIRASKQAAGYDLSRYCHILFRNHEVILFSAQDTVVKAKGKGLVMTDVVVAVPEGYYGRIGM